MACQPTPAYSAQNSNSYAYAMGYDASKTPQTWDPASTRGAPGHTRAGPCPPPQNTPRCNPTPTQRPPYHDDWYYTDAMAPATTRGAPGHRRAGPCPTQQATGYGQGQVPMPTRGIIKDTFREGYNITKGVVEDIRDMAYGTYDVAKGAAYDVHDISHDAAYGTYNAAKDFFRRIEDKVNSIIEGGLHKAKGVADDVMASQILTSPATPLPRGRSAPPPTRSQYPPSPTHPLQCPPSPTRSQYQPPPTRSQYPPSPTRSQYPPSPTRGPMVQPGGSVSDKVEKMHAIVDNLHAKISPNAPPQPRGQYAPSPTRSQYPPSQSRGQCIQPATPAPAAVRAKVAEMHSAVDNLHAIANSNACPKPQPRGRSAPPPTRNQCAPPQTRSQYPPSPTQCWGPMVQTGGPVINNVGPAATRSTPMC